MELKFERKLGRFELTTDKNRMQVDVIYRFLQKSYWADKRSLEAIKKSIEFSLPFGIFDGDRQIGFARVISDYSTFAWIADVYIEEEYRGKGLSKWLMESMLAHPELQDLRRWVLATKDAHALYSQFGFKLLNKPERWMEIDYQPN
ncbi:GNAT family N-acetyltransferase [bacterium]|nr:GNAT family N-acetyltransferase [bacterium]